LSPTHTLDLAQLFAENADEAQLLLDRKKGAKFQGVVAKFEQQLIELLAIIESSETHFVRCIKPNAEKVPNVWVDDMVTKQLRCSGVMEAVRVIAAGYPDRVPHYEIIGRFRASHGILCLTRGNSYASFVDFRRW